MPEGSREEILSERPSSLTNDIQNWFSQCRRELPQKFKSETRGTGQRPAACKMREIKHEETKRMLTGKFPRWSGGDRTLETGADREAQESRFLSGVYDNETTELPNLYRVADS